ncbi:MAG TPA: helix-turn-helix domain-containing protein [Solirubrobacterales bacterium]|nr:helix-turn-helix domain-containing protein [Solirubrobacterales bacterium]
MSGSPKRSETRASEKFNEPMRVLRALSHPVRLRMVEMLAREDASAATLAASSQFPGLTASNLSYHLAKVLGQECGIVEVAETIKKRGANEKMYRLKIEPLANVSQFVPKIFHSALKGTALYSFTKLAADALAANTVDALPESALAWRPVTLDQRGWLEVAKAIADLRDHVQAVEQRSNSRLANDRSGVIQAAFGIAWFKAPPASGPEKSGSDSR